MNEIIEKLKEKTRKLKEVWLDNLHLPSRHRRELYEEFTRMEETYEAIK